MTILDDLRERALLAPDHDWQGHVERSFANTQYKLPGGESLSDARNRALRAFATIAAAGHSSALMVSHGNLIASVLNGIDPAFGFEDWRAMRNPEIYEIALVDGSPVGFRRLG